MCIFFQKSVPVRAAGVSGYIFQDSAQRYMSEEELQALMKSVEDQMLSAAKALDFEKAAKLRDQLFELKGESGKEQQIQKPQTRRRRKKRI